MTRDNSVPGKANAKESRPSADGYSRVDSFALRRAGTDAETSGVSWQRDEAQRFDGAGFGFGVTRSLGKMIWASAREHIALEVFAGAGKGSGWALAFA